MNIQPRTLKGFRDFLPQDMRLRQKVMQTIRTVFEKYGYEPLETPTLEYDDILTGKYGEDEKLMYRFTDHGDRAVAMKYDLTVPAARVIAQYSNQLPTPFKRYQMQPVWRADNTQRGRYRELWQCDADTFGSESILTEAEWMCIGIEVFSALGLTEIAAMLNNRKLIDILLKEIIKCNEQEYHPIAISLDKYDKVGWDGVRDEMLKRQVRPNIVQSVQDIFSVAGSSQDKLTQLEQVVKDNQNGLKALEEIKYVLEYIKSAGFESKFVEFNPLIIRGLAYYTGLVWEWQWLAGGIGSLGGGGRYDGLIGQFIGQNIPAAGGSFGLERIIDVLKDRTEASQKLSSLVMIANFDQTAQTSDIQLAAELRRANLQTLLYPELSKLEKQLKYADHKQIPIVLIQGANEIAKNSIIVKNLIDRTQTEVQKSEITQAVVTELQKVVE